MLILAEPIHGSLKQDVLLFQRIAVPGLQLLHKSHEQLPADKLTDQDQAYLSELSWLEEQGVVFEPEKLPNYELFNQNEEYKRYVERENSLMDTVVKLAKQDTSKDTEKILLRATKGASHDNSRHTAIMLRELMGIDAYPLFVGEPFPDLAAGKQRSEVVSIVLKNLPTPDDSVSWEQILDYRVDPDSKGKFIDLRNWMHEVARSELRSIEIEQKLEYLISQYQRHIKLHKMKAKKGIIETSLVTTLQFAENLVKVKWGEAAKALFEFKYRQIELLEKELTAPGHELAYVLKTQRTFNK